MINLSQIASSLFKKDNRQSKSDGLAVSLEELMEQRKDVRRLRFKNNLRSSTVAGNVKSAFKGRGIEMDEIREYAFGDDVRDIDWRVTARKKTPYTKIYTEERDREIYVVLDLSPSMVFGTRKELKSVCACKVAALLGWMAQENNDRFGAIIFDGENSWQFKPQQNRGHLLSIFNKMSSVSRNIIKQNITATGLKKTLNLMLKGLKSQAVVFLISDFYNFGDEEKKALAMLAKKTQLFCIDVYDSIEDMPPQAGEYMASDGSEKVVFDSRNQKFCDEYHKFFAEKRRKIVDFCRKFNSRTVQIRTDIAVYEQMKFM